MRSVRRCKVNWIDQAENVGAPKGAPARSPVTPCLRPCLQFTLLSGSSQPEKKKKTFKRRGESVLIAVASVYVGGKKTRFCSQQIEQRISGKTTTKRKKTPTKWKLCQTIVNSFLSGSYNSSSSEKFTTTWNYSFRSCSVARAIREPKSISSHKSTSSQPRSKPIFFYFVPPKT